MDITTIVVMLVLTALALAAITWLEIYSRKGARKQKRSATILDLNDK